MKTATTCERGQTDHHKLGFSSIISGSICLLSLGLLIGCSSDSNEAPETAAVRPVKLVTLEPASNLDSRSYPAVIEAATFRELSFQVSGLIEALPAKEGQKVKKGISSRSSTNAISKAASTRRHHSIIMRR